MKVLNLRCEHEHRFEGWFASELEFQSQTERALLACPVCDSRIVLRLPSAPHLGVSKSASSTSEEVSVAGDPQLRAQAQWLQAVRHVLKNTEDVGERFPEEARRIHYGEAKERGIRGHASREDAQALHDEGIEVTALTVPATVKGPLQ